MGGRAKRIQEIMNRAGNEYERRQQQEPPVGGRASRLAQYREQISGHSEAGHDLNQAQYKRPRSNEPGPSSARDLAIEVDTLPLETYEYRGRRGKQLPGTANYIRLRHKPNQTISEYDVSVLIPFFSRSRIKLVFARFHNRLSKFQNANFH